MARAPAGAALVVDVGDERELGYWGEVLTTAAESRGLAGLVIDGCVRDVAALAAHAFPVFSTGLALPRRDQESPRRDRPERRGGGRRRRSKPGDWVVGDGDGVVVVPGAALDAGAWPRAARARRRRSATSPRSAAARRRSSCSGSTPA